MKRIMTNLLWVCFLSFMLFFPRTVSAQELIEQPNFNNLQQEEGISPLAITFPLTVKILNGITITIEIGYGDLISMVKWQIYYRTSIPIAQQRLFYAGRQLSEDNKTVADYGINKADTIALIIRQ